MGNKGRRAQPQNTDQVAMYISVAEDLKEAAREAREALKDLTTERKRVEELIARVPQITEETIGEQLRGEVAKLEQATLRAMDAAVERVNGKFDELSDVLTGEVQKRKTGEPTLSELVAVLTGLPAGTPIQVEVERNITFDDDGRKRR